MMSVVAMNDKIFVAGHRGTVGSAIVCSLHAKGYSNILTRTRGELDLLNRRKVLNVARIRALGWEIKTSLREGFAQAYFDFLSTAAE